MSLGFGMKDHNMRTVMSPGKIARGVILALMFMGLVPPPATGQAVSASDLETQHDRLDESGRRMRIRMDQAIQERVEIIRGRARTKAAYWREEGMSD